jgi:hypothetical protein
MAYPNARALASAIQGQARAGAGQTALTEFFAQRLIVRLAGAFPDQWALKGGHAMLARLPDVARTTRDVDCALSSTSRDAAIEELEHAASNESADPDFLSFELVKAKPGAVEDLASLSFRVRFGGKTHGTVKLDVQVVRDARDLGELVPLGRRVDPAKQGGWPGEISVIPVPDHMAEKLVALYSVHDGHPSSRARDVVDLALLARYSPPQQGALAPALERALARPTVPSVRVELPERFSAPERFRARFEQTVPELDWDTSVAEITEIAQPALAQRAGEGGGREAPSGAAAADGASPAPAADGTVDEGAGSGGEVYVRPHSRGGRQVPGHWRSAPGGHGA